MAKKTTKKKQTKKPPKQTAQRAKKTASKPQKATPRNATKPSKKQTKKPPKQTAQKKSRSIDAAKQDLIQRLIVVLKNYKVQREKEGPKKRKNNIGKVYRGKTKYIDPDEKPERYYVVVKDNGKHVSVAKLKSIKKYDENGRNADRGLVEINYERYGLDKRTGVDFQRFSQNRMSKNPLELADRDVFPKGKEEFILGSHDLSRTLRHTGVKK